MERMDETLFEVPKEAYRDFLRGIKKGTITIDIQKNGDIITHNVVSNKTGHTLCARKCDDATRTETYYIYDEQLDPEEIQPIQVRPVYEVTTPEAFQKILDYLAEKNKNGGTI